MTTTLADRVVRELWRPKTHLPLVMNRPLSSLRNSIIAARKFVLDAAMSAFLADLATVPFKSHKQRMPDVIDSMRHGARLPHQKTWIEYEATPFRERLASFGAADVYGGRIQRDAANVPISWGFMCETYPDAGSAVAVRTFCSSKELVLAVPFEWVYNCLDEPLPWPDADLNSGMFAHGVTPYVCDYVGVRYDKLLAERGINVKLPNKTFVTPAVIVEMTGSLRYLFAFLATLNDAPVVTATVTPSTGYIARGAYRKFLEHTTVRLVLPASERERTARKLIVAVRKRAHQVRGHWRILPAAGPICETGTHLWTAGIARQTCGTCGTRRCWITEHQRGDASLGFVTRQYAVGHKTQEPAA